MFLLLCISYFFVHPVSLICYINGMEYRIYDNKGDYCELTDMLDCRERRAALQHELLSEYGKPIISFSMNIAGPVKNSPMIRRASALGNRYLCERLRALHIPVLRHISIDEKTGCEDMYVADHDALRLKSICCDIESTHSLGRLFDLDVLDASGRKAERSELGLPPRSCIICGGDVRLCAGSRRHSAEELQARTFQILKEGLDEEDRAYISSTAARALLYEVCTTPKPGLVDRANCGSHRDMDIFTFVDSVTALLPYFGQCFMAGRHSADQPPSETFSAIRGLGAEAEGHMLSATAGVNTHKGAIFSMGTVCAALGRLPRELWSDSSLVLGTCADMTEGLVKKDLADLEPSEARTAGQRLYSLYGISGVRGEMEAGLPSVSETGLPVLEEGLRRGLGPDRAGSAALLAIIANSVDTNIIARSDLDTQRRIAGELSELLESDPYPSVEKVSELDRRFMDMNISPGGSADLLAVTYMLHFLKEKET